MKMGAIFKKKRETTVYRGNRALHGFHGNEHCGGPLFPPYNPHKMYKQTDSSIVLCLLNSNGQVDLYSFYSRGQTLQGAEVRFKLMKGVRVFLMATFLAHTQPAFTSPSHKYEDGFLLCEYVRNPQLSIENGMDFNLEEDEYHLLLAILQGPTGSPGEWPL